jgi:hypothetical protein
MIFYKLLVGYLFDPRLILQRTPASARTPTSCALSLAFQIQINCSQYLSQCREKSDAFALAK